MKPHAIITGASSGLGLESAKALASAGYDLTMVARGAERLEKTATELRSAYPELSIKSQTLDVSDFNEVAAFAATVAGPVDILMNNAGLMGPDFKLSQQGIETQMATNHLGHFVLTAKLWDQLNQAESPKVISLSSVVHRKGNLDTADLDSLRGSDPAKYNRWQRYADTKLACLYFARELDIRANLAGSKVQSIAAHPGWAITGLQENFPHVLDPFAQNAAQGAQSQILAALSAEIESGDFVGPRFELWGKPKVIAGSKRSRNLEVASRLWELSEQLTEVKFLA
jgi:NAD(P)-dependent dehydrogenase (short-subunit alcohol dehydrogenase family)